MLTSGGFGIVLTALILCLCAFTAVMAELSLWKRPVRVVIYIVTVLVVLAWCGIVFLRFVTIN